MIDFELLDGAIEDARMGAHNMQHTQYAYICSTGMCLAGFIAVRAGAELPALPAVTAADGWWVRPDGSMGDQYDDDDDTVHVGEYAEVAVGLSVDQANAFFCGDNSLKHIRDMRNALHENPNANIAELKHKCTHTHYLND